MEENFRRMIFRKVIFLLAAAILLVYGCGSDSDSSSSLPNADRPDFSGDYEFYNEFFYCYYGYLNFRASISQTGDQAVLTITNAGQRLDCKLNGDELICSGTLDLDDVQLSFKNFTLWYTSSRALEGESDYTITSANGSCSDGKVEITTTLPDTGSAYIANYGSRTYAGLMKSQCGADQWTQVPVSSSLAPGRLWYFTDVATGCFDVAICQNMTQDSESDCSVYRNLEVKRAATLRINIDRTESAMSFPDRDTLYFEDSFGSTDGDIFGVGNVFEGTIIFDDTLDFP